jgi:hypothetical protein
MRIRRTLGLRATIAISLVATGCGTGYASVGGHGEIVGALRHAPASFRRHLLCIRLGNHDLRVVVRDRQGKAPARVFLASRHFNGKIESRTIYEYNLMITKLATQIERSEPRSLGPVPVGHEIYSGQVVCPRAVIEVGSRGQTPRANLLWARYEIERYGSDLVSYRFYAEVKAN